MANDEKGTDKQTVIKLASDAEGEDRGFSYKMEDLAKKLDKKILLEDYSVDKKGNLVVSTQYQKIHDHIEFNKLYDEFIKEESKIHKDTDEISWDDVADNLDKQREMLKEEDKLYDESQKKNRKTEILPPEGDTVLPKSSDSEEKWNIINENVKYREYTEKNIKTIEVEAFEKNFTNSYDINKSPLATAERTVQDDGAIVISDPKNADNSLKVSLTEKGFNYEIKGDVKDHVRKSENLEGGSVKFEIKDNNIIILEVKGDPVGIEFTKNGETFTVNSDGKLLAADGGGKQTEDKAPEQTADKAPEKTEDKAPEKTAEKIDSLKDSIKREHNVDVETRKTETLGILNGSVVTATDSEGNEVFKAKKIFTGEVGTEKALKDLKSQEEDIAQVKEELKKYDISVEKIKPLDNGDSELILKKDGKIQDAVILKNKGAGINEELIDKLGSVLAMEIALEKQIEVRTKDLEDKYGVKIQKSQSDAGTKDVYAEIVSDEKIIKTKNKPKEDYMDSLIDVEKTLKRAQEDAEERITDNIKTLEKYSDEVAIKKDGNGFKAEVKKDGKVIDEFRAEDKSSELLNDIQIAKGLDRIILALKEKESKSIDRKQDAAIENDGIETDSRNTTTFQDKLKNEKEPTSKGNAAHR